MWQTQTDGSWIQYEFDRAYKLHELLVWNSNQVIESFIGFGVKEAIIEVENDTDVFRFSIADQRRHIDWMFPVFGSGFADEVRFVWVMNRSI